MSLSNSSRILGEILCTVLCVLLLPSFSFYIQSTSIFSLPICRDSNGTYSFMWNPNHTEDWNSITRNTTLWPLGGMSGDRTRVSRVESEHETRSATKYVQWKGIFDWIKIKLIFGSFVVTLGLRNFHMGGEVKWTFLLRFYMRYYVLVLDYFRGWLAVPLLPYLSLFLLLLLLLSLCPVVLGI